MCFWRRDSEFPVHKFAGVCQYLVRFNMAGLTSDQFYKAVGKELGNLSDNAAAMRAAKIDQPLNAQEGTVIQDLQSHMQ